jgi:hypothetical protein
LTKRIQFATVRPVITWGEFRGKEAQMAADGAALLYDVGVGLGYLATTRADGGPRVHPMCPLITDDGLYAFIVPSPKQRDLHRDGRFALHSFPLGSNEDAFYVVGRARLVESTDLRHQLGEQFATERSALNVQAPGPDQDLFEFLIDTAMLTRTTGHGDPAPVHSVWHAAR